MLFRETENITEKGQDRPPEHRGDGDPKREPATSPSLYPGMKRETGNGLTRLGKKLKHWYLKNGNTTFIPDIHLIVDDDRP